MTPDEARVRLEGALELVEAGTDRYRAAVKHLADVLTARPDLERLISAEEALDEAAAKVALLVARDGPAELQRALDALVGARRELRLRLRFRLEKLGVEPFMKTLAQEVELLLENVLPPLELPPVAQFDIEPRLHLALAAACVLTAVVFISVVAFAPQLAWVAMTIPLAAAATAYWGARRKLDLYSDRLLMTPRIGRVLEVSLKSGRLWETLKATTEHEREQLETMIELLKHPAFARAGRVTGEALCEAEPNDGDETVVAVVSRDEALLIIDKGADTLNAAVGQRCSWTQPRAWVLGYLLVRMPRDDRERLVTRLTVAGLARTVARAEFERAFTVLW